MYVIIYYIVYVYTLLDQILFSGSPDACPTASESDELCSLARLPMFCFFLSTHLIRI